MRENNKTRRKEEVHRHQQQYKTSDIKLIYWSSAPTTRKLLSPLLLDFPPSYPHIAISPVVAGLLKLRTYIRRVRNSVIITLFTGPPGWWCCCCCCRCRRGHGGNEITFLYLKWKTHICSGQAESSQASSQAQRNVCWSGITRSERGTGWGTR